MHDAMKDFRRAKSFRFVHKLITFDSYVDVLILDLTCNNVCLALLQSVGIIS